MLYGVFFVLSVWDGANISNLDVYNIVNFFIHKDEHPRRKFGSRWDNRSLFDILVLCIWCSKNFKKNPFQLVGDGMVATCNSKFLSDGVANLKKEDNIQIKFYDIDIIKEILLFS